MESATTPKPPQNPIEMEIQTTGIASLDAVVQEVQGDKFCEVKPAGSETGFGVGAEIQSYYDIGLISGRYPFIRDVAMSPEGVVNQVALRLEGSDDVRTKLYERATDIWTSRYQQQKELLPPEGYEVLFSFGTNLDVLDRPGVLDLYNTTAQELNHGGIPAWTVMEEKIKQEPIVVISPLMSERPNVMPHADRGFAIRGKLVEGVIKLVEEDQDLTEFAQSLVDEVLQPQVSVEQ